MSTDLYVIKTHPANISNLCLALMLKTAKTKAFGASDFSIDRQFLNVNVGNFATQFTELTNTNFRQIDWAQWAPSLAKTVELAKSQNKIIIFGCADDLQIQHLKDYFSTNITTVGLDYTESLHPTLINNMVKYHLYLQACGKLPITDLDVSIRSSKSSTELINYYQSAFANLMPTTHSCNFDYNISVDDFFKKSVILKHINNLGFDTTEESESFYDHWLSTQ